MSDVPLDAPHHGGETLRARLGQPLPAGRALAIALRIGRALEPIHHAGSAYGHLQPENVLLGGGDRVSLIDPGSGLPRVEPTAAYQAPEWAAGQPATPAGDIYALGCLLYEMLTGRSPAAAAGEASPTGRPPLSRQLNPAVPRAVERVVLRALVEQPDGRFPDAGAMVEAMQRCRPTWTRAPLVGWDRLALRLEAGIGLGRALLIAALAAVVIVALVLVLWGLGRIRQQQADLQRTEEAASLTGEGERHLAAGAADGAMASCQEALGLDPENRQAQACVQRAAEGQRQADWFAAAIAYVEQGQWPQALGQFERLRQVQPDYPGLDDQLRHAYLEYGQYLVQEGDLDGAVAQFDALLAWQPADTTALGQRRRADLTRRGRSAYEAGAWTEAAAALQQVYELDSAYQTDLPELLYGAYLGQARALEQEGHWCAAWQAYDQAEQVAEADTAEAQAGLEAVRVRCWPPTPTPTPTPTSTSTPSPTPTPTATPTPKPRAAPVRYCYVGQFTGIEEIAFPLISIRGRVVDRNGQGVGSVRVRVGAWNWSTEVLTGRKGNFRVDGLSEPIEWTVSLPEYGVEVKVPISDRGQMGVVEFVQKRCP